MNQKYTSKDTSINTVNKIYKTYNFPANSLILDYGGGKYDTNQEYMASKGIKLIVFDPYNRSKTHNAQVLKRAKLGVDYIVCSNVLNVIAEPEVIRDVLETIKHLAKNKAKVVVENRLVDVLTPMKKDKYPDLEIDCHQGDQPLYYYLISLE